MSNTPSDTKTENLGFTIENRAGADVVVWKEGGCRPATSAEIAMWKALSAVQRPVVREPLTDHEIELIDGMIEVQLRHAQRCDSIPNRPMAEKQKGWDMERVTLLRKLKATMGGQQQ